VNPHQHKKAPLFIPDILKFPAPAPDNWIYSEPVHYHEGPSSKVKLQVHTHKGAINICSAKAVYEREGRYSPAGRKLMSQELCNAIWAAFLHKCATLTYEETADVCASLRFAKALTA
jgi:hypothetical protein